MDKSSQGHAQGEINRSEYHETDAPPGDARIYKLSGITLYVQHISYLQTKIKRPSEIVEVDGCSNSPVCNDRTLLQFRNIHAADGDPSKITLKSISVTCSKLMQLPQWEPLTPFSMYRLLGVLQFLNHG